MIRKIVFSAISLLAVLVLANCWGTDVEDRDKPVYTWEGRLFGSPSETAWANKEVYLVVYRQKLIQMIRDTLDITVTDENGYFKMEYKELNQAVGKYNEDGSNGGGLGYVALSIAGPDVLQAAFNVDVKRDFCLNQRTFLQITFLLEDTIHSDDSLFMRMGNYAYNFTNIHDLGDYNYAITGPLYPNGKLMLEFNRSSNFTFLPKSFDIKYGRNLEMMEEKLFEVREWPYIDSIALKF